MEIWYITILIFVLSRVVQHQKNDFKGFLVNIILGQVILVESPKSWESFGSGELRHSMNGRMNWIAGCI